MPLKPTRTCSQPTPTVGIRDVLSTKTKIPKVIRLCSLNILTKDNSSLRTVTTRSLSRTITEGKSITVERNLDEIISKEQEGDVASKKSDNNTSAQTVNGSGITAITKEIGILTIKGKRRNTTNAIETSKKKTTPIRRKRIIYYKKLIKEVTTRPQKFPYLGKWTQKELLLPQISQLVNDKRIETNVSETYDPLGANSSSLTLPHHLSDIPSDILPSPTDTSKKTNIRDNIPYKAYIAERNQEEIEISLLKKFIREYDRNYDLKNKRNKREYSIDMKMLLRLSAYDTKLTQLHWMRLQRTNRRAITGKNDQMFSGFKAEKNLQYCSEGLLKIMAIDQVIIRNDVNRRNMIIDQYKKGKHVGKRCLYNYLNSLNFIEKRVNTHEDRINNGHYRKISISCCIPKILSDLYDRSYDQIVKSFTAKKIARIEGALKDYRLVEIDDKGKPQNLAEYLSPYKNMWDAYNKQLK